MYITTKREREIELLQPIGKRQNGKKNNDQNT